MSAQQQAVSTETMSGVEQPFRHAIECYTWNRWTWDIARLQADIDERKLRVPRIVLDRAFIVAYAMQILCLDLKKGRDQEGFGIFGSVDMKAVFDLPMSALDAPLILVCPPKGRGLLRLDGEDEPNHVLADGNHRLARAFLEGRDALVSHVLSLPQSRRYLDE